MMCVRVPTPHPKKKEKGLGENTRVLSEKAITEDPNGDEDSGGRKKKQI